MLTLTPKAEARFWSMVQKGPDLFSCWLWTGCRDRGGYGRFTHGGKVVGAHRFAYEMLVGPIPTGLELDHVKAWGCEHRHCVNPAHLEAVLHVVNVRRGDGGRNERDKTHCPQGHAYDETNTCHSGGKRYCLACSRTRSSRDYRRRKAKHALEAMKKPRPAGAFPPRPGP